MCLECIGEYLASIYQHTSQLQRYNASENLINYTFISCLFHALLKSGQVYHEFSSVFTFYGN